MASDAVMTLINELISMTVKFCPLVKLLKSGIKLTKWRLIAISAVAKKRILLGDDAGSPAWIFNSIGVISNTLER
ncbi:hypothetical protein PcPA57_11700 [Pasteurella canis]|uniref:Uncharacterized protein n=1 Tax=Pasteurella canis TaxID=753 RepID=A0ABQ4VDY8_9PAST|nr:hypothetical protein PA42_04320 [Pasteurella canis]GJJ80450.1 hypothetical protein PcPA57_11700 [Pasteurella canis]